MCETDEMVRRLDAGQEVDRFHAFTHKSALMTACCFGHTSAVEPLLDRGADLTIRDREADLPLHFAAQNGRVDVVRGLLRNGANKHLTNAKGKTPLRVAEENHKFEIRALLRDPPHTPEPPRLAEAQSRMLKLAWSCPASLGAKVDGFELQWRASHDSPGFMVLQVRDTGFL